jgi:hypothetical protein
MVAQAFLALGSHCLQSWHFQAWRGWPISLSGHSMSSVLVDPELTQTGSVSGASFLATPSGRAPGLRQAAAESFDKLISPKYNDTVENEAVRDDY